MKDIINEVHKYKITRTSDGRWSTYIKDTSKPHNRRLIKRKSRKDLYEFLLRYYGSSGSAMTFSDLFREFLGYKQKFICANNSKRSLSPSTIRRYERDYDKYIKGSKLSQMWLMDITSTQLEMILADMIKAHSMRESCAKNILGYICQCFSYAHRSGYISVDPTLRVDKNLLLSLCYFTPPKADNERVLTGNDMQALYRAILEHEKKCPSYMPDYAIELAMFTGMRVGEIAALHWSDIDDDFIYIRYSEHRLDYKGRASEFVIGEPKNGKHRVIQMTDAVRNVFDKIRALGFHSDDDFIFIYENGQRYSARAISCSVKKRAADANIKHTSIHEIRRTVSSFLNMELPQRVVANMLGHSPQVNEAHYNYDTAENAEKRHALEKMYSKVFNFTDFVSEKKIAENA